MESVLQRHDIWFSGHVQFTLRPYPTSCATICGTEFADDSMEIPVCIRIWLRVKFDISSAKSASRICDSDETAFSREIFRFRMVFWRRETIDPRNVRVTSLELIAPINNSMAAWAEEVSDTCS